eukprot:905692_1
MAFTFVFVAFIAFFSYLFCNRIRSICPSLSSCQDLPKSDVLYDWTDEDEDEEAVHPNEEAVHPNDAIKTNVCFAGSNIILYERSRSAEARVQKIKEDYIDTLVEQLKLKVVLAKKIALFKFLSPHYIVMTCTELDNEFKIEDYDLFTSDEQIIEYLNRIKYGESHIDKIRIIFPDLMDYDALKQEWTAHRHHVFIGHLKDLGYKQFWSQYLRNDGWTEANPDLTILALVLVVICLASVNCERGFSLMNIIKSILSNRLRVELVCDLMTIKGSGWSVDFAVDEKGDVVIDKYKQMKTRRGAVAPYTKPSYEMKRKNKNK